jgi:thiamine pyrophosphokinase
VYAFANRVDKLCTATSMLRLGLNTPRVQVIIYIAIASTLKQYVQESRHASYLGNTAYSIILISRVYIKTGKEIRCLPYKLNKYTTAFLNSTVCCRIAINTYIDARFNC